MAAEQNADVVRNAQLYTTLSVDLPVRGYL
jgi:hypothetical protein